MKQGAIDHEPHNNPRKKVLGIFIFIAALFLLVDILNIYRICVYSCIRIEDDIVRWWFVFLLVNIVIIFLLRFGSKEAFQVWWGYAKFANLIIFSVSFFVGLKFHHSPGGWFNLDDEIDLLYHLGLIVLFLVGSVGILLFGKSKHYT